jgi:RimJ/RimL family protein N-acetyltransferase
VARFAGTDEIPYRIEVVGGPVIRCWEPRDAPLLKDAVDSSLEHLRPWMPWAHDEPQSLDEKVSLLRFFRGRFDLGEDFVYGVFAADESMVLGGTGLHTRAGEGALEIGYWIRASHAGRGLGTAVAGALTKVGIASGGAERMDILVDPANEVSRRIPTRLGYREEAVLRRRLPTADGSPRRDAVIFSLLAEELPSSPAAEAELRIFDACGRDLSEA